MHHATICYRRNGAVIQAMAGIDIVQIDLTRTGFTQAIAIASYAWLPEGSGLGG